MIRQETCTSGGQPRFTPGSDRRGGLDSFGVHAGASVAICKAQKAVVSCTKIGPDMMATTRKMDIGQIIEERLTGTHSKSARWKRQGISLNQAERNDERGGGGEIENPALRPEKEKRCQNCSKRVHPFSLFHPLASRRKNLEVRVFHLN